MAGEVPVVLRARRSAAGGGVSETWRPLGYNIRPKRLQSIAQQAVEKYDGKLPSDRETLLSFKGIGEYTAGAIRSFAFRERAAILDTNVARVLFRIFVGKGDPKSHAMKKHLWAVSASVLPHKHVFDFNQALMDFGATHCSARKPKCPSVLYEDAFADQLRDEIAIGLGKRQRTPARRAIDPPHLLAHHRLGLALQVASIEKQLDASSPDTRA